MARLKYLERELALAPFYALCTSESDFKAELKRLNVHYQLDYLSKGAAATTHIIECDKGTICLVCLPKGSKYPRNSVSALLVHEAVHVWQSVRDEMGEKEPSSEFEAYAIQKISQRLMNAYWKCRN